MARPPKYGEDTTKVTVALPISIVKKVKEMNLNISEFLTETFSKNDLTARILYVKDDEDIINEVLEKKLKTEHQVIALENTKKEIDFKIETLKIKINQLEKQYIQITEKKEIKTEKVTQLISKIEKLRSMFCYVENVLARKSFCSLLDLKKALPEELENEEYLQLFKLYSEENKSYSFEQFSTEADPLFFVKTGLRKEVVCSRIPEKKVPYAFPR